MKRVVLLVMLFCLILLSGCQNEETKKLTVYTYSSFPVSLQEQIQTYFKTQHEVEVEFQSFSDTGPIFNQLIQEKQNPQADVVIGLDNNYFFKAKAAGLFESYQPAGLSAVPEDLIFDPEYQLIPYDYGYVVFNYDREKLERVPQTYEELLDPVYQGKIIITNPLTSSPGQTFLLTTIAVFGEEGYLDYWRNLKNNLLTITSGWDEAYGIYTNGEAPIVLSYGTSPVYHLLYDDTERYQPLVLDDAAYAQIEGAGIVKNASNLKYARLLMDYLLSVEFQALIPENQFMYPVRQDVELPQSFRIAAKAKRLLNLEPSYVEANLEKWLTEWENVINQ